MITSSQSIGRKLVRYVFGVYFILTFVVTLFQMYQEYRHTKTSSFSDIVNLEINNKDNLGNAVWEYDTTKLNTVIAGLNNFDIVAGVRVLDERKEMIAKIGDTADGTRESTEVPVEFNADLGEGAKIVKLKFKDGSFLSDLYEYSFKIIYRNKKGDEPDRLVGYGAIYTTERIFAQKLKYGFLLIVVNSFIKTFGLFLIFSVMVGIVVIKPLNGFSSSISKMNPKKPVRDDFVNDMTKRTDEIGEMAGTFNRFIDSIEENLNEINDLNKNLERKVEERTLALAQKTQKIQAMLQSLSQGIFTFGGTYKIDEEYSKFLETIFGTSDIVDKDYAELIFKDALIGKNDLDQVVQAVQSAVDCDSLAFELNRHLLVSELTREVDGKKQYLELEWEIIVDDDDTVSKMLVVVRDVTELRLLTEQSEADRIELEIIGKILKVGPEQAIEFIGHANNYLDGNQKIIEKIGSKTPAMDDLNVLFRNMHTIKGNSRSLDFTSITEVVHVTEEYYSQLKGDLSLWDSKKLLEDLDKVRAALGVYTKLLDDKLSSIAAGGSSESAKFYEDAKSIFMASNFEKAGDKEKLTVINKLYHGFISTLYVTLKDVLKVEIDALDSMASNLGKAKPVVNWDLNDVVYDKSDGNFLKDIMTHLLRNSLDHGIEKPEKRAAKGKSEVGAIFIKTTQDTIELNDDGGGLNLNVLAKKGQESGLFGADASDEDISQVIFASGVSTAEQVSDISGRGVGMDAVKSMLEEKGGSIKLVFTDKRSDDGNRPFKFIIGFKGKKLSKAS